MKDEWMNGIKRMGEKFSGVYAEQCRINEQLVGGKKNNNSTAPVGIYRSLNCCQKEKKKLGFVF